MPRGDGTGPMGVGAMTGRRAGYCTGFGIGFGRSNDRGGQGGGFGRRNRFFATGVPGRAQFGGFAAPFQKIDTETEEQAFQRHVDLLQSEMDAIKKRLDELTAKG